MVPVDDQGLTVKRRRAALAVPVLGVHLTEVLFPEQLAVRVQTVETARTEKREHMLAIRDGRRRRQAGSLMARFVRWSAGRRALRPCRVAHATAANCAVPRLRRDQHPPPQRVGKSSLGCRRTSARGDPQFGVLSGVEWATGMILSPCLDALQPR